MADAPAEIGLGIEHRGPGVGVDPRANRLKLMLQSALDPVGSLKLPAAV